MSQRILVIDDNEEILDLFQALLSDADYEVILSDFIDPRDISQIQPDIIILDYLAGMEPRGGQILRVLKQQRTTRHIPVIVCTTISVAAAEQEPAFCADGVRLVFKPFSVPELLHSVEQALAETGLSTNTATC